MTGTAQIFRVMLTMQIKPGCDEDFERVWLEIGDAVTSHPANLGQSLSKGSDGVYYITSDWVGEPQFREFEHGERHLAHREKLHPYRSGGSMATMHVVAELAPTNTGTAGTGWESRA